MLSQILEDSHGHGDEKELLQPLREQEKDDMRAHSSVSSEAFETAQYRSMLSGTWHLRRNKMNI